MIFVNFLHDLTFKLNDDLIEIDKIIRLKKEKTDFLDIKNNNTKLIQNINNKIQNHDKNFLFKERHGKYLTHHELHAYSVIQFIKKNNIKIDEIYILVNDGSGNMYLMDNMPLGECISLYYYNFNDLRIKNIFSYLHNSDSNLFKNYSPCLLYLIASGHLNLEFGEESKVLAFESKVKDFNNSKKIKKIDKITDYLTKIFYKNFRKNLIQNNKISNKYKIKKAEQLYNIFENLFTIKNINYKLLDNKYITAYMIQSLYEKNILSIVKYIIEKYKIKNLGGAGGGFLNVKLNNLILNLVPEKLIINPSPSDLGINFFRNKNDVINSYSNRYFLEEKTDDYLNA